LEGPSSELGFLLKNQKKEFVTRQTISEEPSDMYTPRDQLPALSRLEEGPQSKPLIEKEYLQLLEFNSGRVPENEETHHFPNKQALRNQGMGVQGEFTLHPPKQLSDQEVQSESEDSEEVTKQQSIIQNIQRATAERKQPPRSKETDTLELSFQNQYYQPQVMAKKSSHNEAKLRQRLDSLIHAESFQNAPNNYFEELVKQTMKPSKGTPFRTFDLTPPNPVTESETSNQR
jgi:hypothetical protein